MMVPNLTATGSGGGVPGIPGRSVELQTSETAIQWRQTGGEWQDLVPLSEITGADGDPGKNVELRKTATAIQWRQVPDGVWADLVLLSTLQGGDGDDGKSVELQKSATAIQWRQTGGAFADLVQLTDLKGDPGDDFAVQYNNGVVDLGPVRMAWGSADSILGTPEAFLFPAEFAAPPIVQITRQSPGSVLVPQAVTTTGFSINRGDLLPSPIPFQWQASGLKPDPSVIPSARFDIPGLPIWSAAVRAQRAGKRNARILCIGDSTTMGAGANGASAVNNDKAGSYPTQLAARLTSRGSLGSWQSAVGTNNAASVVSFDNRWTVPVGWSVTSDPTGATLGGYCLYTNGSIAQASFTATTAWDTLELYTVQRAVTGSSGWRVSIDGVEVGTITALFDNTSPGNVVKTTFKTALGAHIVRIRAIDEEWNFFCGLSTYNSAQKEISVLNAGWSAGKAADVANGVDRAYAPLSILPTYNPDLVIINLGINDANQATPTSKTAWIASMQKIISTCLSSGADVLLVKPNDIETSYKANLTTYGGYIDELATANGLRTLDLKTRLGSYTAANAAGWMRDVLHPNAVGYGEVATAIADFIMPVGA